MSDGDREIAFNEMMRRWERSDARAEERHKEILEGHKRLFEGHDRLLERHDRLFERHQRSEGLFIEVMSDIDASIQRNTEQLDDMGEAIRANTRAVLSVLDRLEPGSA